MNEVRVRINKISLWDFKNVSHGTINFNAEQLLRDEKSHIMGLYGQNASGKTVLVEALGVLRQVMSGNELPPYLLNYIAHGKNGYSMEVEFVLIDDSCNFSGTARYGFTVARHTDPNESNEKPKIIVKISNEKLHAGWIKNGKLTKMQKAIETNEICELKMDAKKKRELFGCGPLASKELEEQRILTLNTSRSFIFASQTSNIMDKNLDESENIFSLIISVIINRLKVYAIRSLYVIEEQAGKKDNFYMVINAGTENKLPWGIPDLLNKVVSMPQKYANDIKRLLPSVNQVLSCIAPGFSLKCDAEKSSLDKDDDYHNVELFSYRKDVGNLPIKNESVGIKKIVSFITLFSEAYNNPGFTLVIDELDASIFEYLLGDLLDIFMNHGKGQLLFTSHNLRPLEKLQDCFVWFTTIDPDNRYKQLSKKAKATNNLRNMYLRAIHLEYEDGKLYNGTSKYELARSLRKAGELI
ncbi:MAG: ATP-binding protein [Defluviitaleaceae bacterium]|nr:ATP-binding protein [Defluviitaleaceae bacterium]